jgi:hypothetical protein
MSPGRCPAAYSAVGAQVGGVEELVMLGRRLKAAALKMCREDQAEPG